MLENLGVIDLSATGIFIVLVLRSVFDYLGTKDRKENGKAPCRIHLEKDFTSLTSCLHHINESLKDASAVQRETLEYIKDLKRRTDV